MFILLVALGVVIIFLQYTGRWFSWLIWNKNGWVISFREIVLTESPDMNYQNKMKEKVIRTMSNFLTLFLTCQQSSFYMNFADFFNFFLIFLTFVDLPDFPDHTALSRYSSIFPVYEMWEMRIAKGGGGFLNIVDIYLIKCSLFTVFSICHIVIQYIFHVFIWDA